MRQSIHRTRLARNPSSYPFTISEVKRLSKLRDREVIGTPCSRNGCDRGYVAVNAWPTLSQSKKKIYIYINK